MLTRLCCLRVLLRTAGALHVVASMLQCTGQRSAAGMIVAPNTTVLACLCLLAAVIAAPAPAAASSGMEDMLQDFNSFSNNCPGAWWKAAPAIWWYFASPFVRILQGPPTDGTSLLSGASVIGIVYAVLFALVFMLSTCCVGVSKTCSAMSTLCSSGCVAALVCSFCMWPIFAYTAWLQRNYPTWCYGFISFTVSGIVCGVAPLVVAAGLLFAITQYKKHEWEEKLKIKRK